ncbi:hypothetical protein V6Z12_D11G094800 [Gossypium hirsutum]
MLCPIVLNVKQNNLNQLSPTCVRQSFSVMATFFSKGAQSFTVKFLATSGAPKYLTGKQPNVKPVNLCTSSNST